MTEKCEVEFPGVRHYTFGQSSDPPAVSFLSSTGPSDVRSVVLPFDVVKPLLSGKPLVRPRRTSLPYHDTPNPVVFDSVNTLSLDEMADRVRSLPAADDVGPEPDPDAVDLL